jgi:hypothetical protein
MPLQGIPPPSSRRSPADDGSVLLQMQTPALKAQLDYCFMFALRRQNEAYDNYLLSNYSGLCFLDDPKFEMWDPFDFYPAPRFTQLNRAGVLTVESHDLWSAPSIGREALPGFLREQIDNGRYIYAVADYFYFPDSFYYAIKAYPHPILIVGYRRESNEFAIVGQFQKHNRGLSAIKWTSMMKNGFQGLVWVKTGDLVRSIDYDCSRIEDAGLKQYSLWGHKYIEALNVNETAQYEFSTLELADDLSAYLDSSRRPECDKRHGRRLGSTPAVFGLGVYVHLERLVKAVCSGECRHFVHIPIRVFWEHKDFMLERALHVRDVLGRSISETTIQELRAVTRMARRFRFLYVEAAMQSRAPAEEDWVRSLRKCRELEEVAYARFRDELIRE